LILFFGGSAFLIFKVVQRARKCADFAATIMLIHLLICTAYDGIPNSFSWWLFSASWTVLLAVVSEYLCVRKEMMDIPLNTLSLEEMSVF
jgi:hypothetical protein